MKNSLLVYILIHLLAQSITHAQGEQDSIYSNVDIMPEYPGGNEMLYIDIAEKMTYPSDARKGGVEGKVYVEFIVSKTGQVTNVRSIKGPSESLKKVGEVAISNLKPFSPGIRNGVPVKVKMVLPVSFQLGSARLPRNIQTLDELSRTNIVVTINDAGLTEIGQEILEFEQMTFLDLERNKISILPDYLLKMDKLVELHLSKNRLIALPEEINALSNLETLSLFENSIQTLPEGICQLEDLQLLDLGRNQLYELPENFGNLKSLRSLNLSGNHLKQLPESFSSLKRLKELDISGNDLDESQITKLKNELKRTKIISD